MNSTSNVLTLNTSKSSTKPSAGKTMLSLLKTYGNNLHNSHIALIEELKSQIYSGSNKNWIDKHLLFTSFANSKPLLEKEKIQLISASLLLNWICGRILNLLPSNSNLYDAEVWFHNSNMNDSLTRLIKPEIQEKILSHLRKLDIQMMADELPYLSEVFETGNEIATEKGSGRIKKKSNGIYYTPTDVIDFIVNRSFDNSKIDDSFFSNTTWYDPALGTGSFLLAVMKQYDLKKNSHSKTLHAFCQENLFGSDISPIALQSSVYILSTHCLLLTQSSNLKELALSIGKNLAMVDATSISDKKKLSKIFPQIGEQGVNFIISNPPYSKKKQLQHDLIFHESVPKNIFGNDLYPYFIKLLLDLIKPINGGGGMVVPLSLSASSKENMKVLRNYIQNKKGSFEFLNFDRTPDSLFGDDVKTRNTIFFFNQKCESDQYNNISSSYLHRWNSRNRENLFNSISVTNLQSEIDITKGVPKVGDDFGLSILNKLISKQSGNLSEIITSTRTNPKLITRTTAYNWIPVELNISDENQTGRIFWEIKLKEISPATIYALLNSRITYWLWRIWSDGFHLTNQFINNLPFGELFFQDIDTIQIDKLGNALWTEAQNDVILTKNAGVQSYSYCPVPYTDIINEIDEAIVNYFSLPKITINYLTNFINQLIVAGRENESRIKTKIRYLQQTN